MRPQAVVIGVDVGTTSTKAGAYRLDGSAVATANVETRLRRAGPGHVDQDPEELLDSAYHAIAGCLQSGLRSADVKAIAVTGQMAGTMGIDEDWRPVTPYDSWLDSRCSDQLRRLASAHGELVATRTGCPPMLNHAPKMQWWRDECPRDYARIARFVMPAAFIAGQMAGLSAEDAFIDPTYLHFTGVADGLTGAWSSQLIAALNLDQDKLPRIVPSDAVVGHLTQAAAERSGLKMGTPVAAGLGDTAAGALGAGVVRPGQLLDTAGTAAVLLGSVDAFRPDAGQSLIAMRGFIPGQWLPLNYVAGGGLCIPWLMQLGTRPDDPRAHPSVIETLLKEAADVPLGAGGLIFMPHVEGRIAPHDPEMRGGWTGLSLAHDRAHLARSMLEAIAFEYATYLDAMRRLHVDVEFASARAIGGGARSTLWNSIKADVLGVAVERVDADETATRGAGLVAASAAGLIGDISEVAAGVPTTDRVDPDARRHAQYRPLVDRYASLLDLLAGHRTDLTHTPERELVA